MATKKEPIKIRWNGRTLKYEIVSVKLGTVYAECSDMDLALRLKNQYIREIFNYGVPVQLSFNFKD